MAFEFGNLLFRFEYSIWVSGFAFGVGDFDFVTRGFAVAIKAYKFELWVVDFNVSGNQDGSTG